MALGTSSVFVWQTQYQDDRDYADEWWISTQPQYHAFVFNYYDKGYLVRNSDNENEARAAIDSYTDAVAKRFKELFGLIIISPPASYYNSPLDQCKGTVTNSNIDALCQHVIKHTDRNNVQIDFWLSMPQNNKITSVLWSGHRVTSTSASGAPENNRSMSYGGIVLMLEIPLGHLIDQTFTGTLMHELCHQYDGKDHYHEEKVKEDPETCVNRDICSKCQQPDWRPGSCVMNHSNIDISASTVLCEDCKKEIRTHLQKHH